jgi:hypothetical protein
MWVPSVFVPNIFEGIGLGLILVPFNFKYEIWFLFQFLIGKEVLISIIFFKNSN